MKAFAFILLLCAGFAAQQVQAVTMGEVLAGLCPEALAAIDADYTILQALGAGIADYEVDIPEGYTPLLVAPTDTAFLAVLDKLSLTADQILADTDLLTTIISLHLAAAPSLEATTATTLNGEELGFLVSKAPASLSDYIASALPKALSLLGTKQTTNVSSIVACPAGVVVSFVDTVLLPTVTAAGPAAAPAPAPEGPITLTIGEFVSNACPDVLAALGSPDFVTLLGLLSLPEVAATKITIPADGEVVIAAPTNEAFGALLAKIDPTLVNNATVVIDLLANHIAFASSVTDVAPAVALSGAPMNFWRLVNGSPTAISIADLAAVTADGAITDGDSNVSKVAGAVTCPADQTYVFVVDTVLVPAAYESFVATAPAPAVAPAAAPTPAPAPVSSAAAATFGLATAAAMVAAVLA